MSLPKHMPALDGMRAVAIMLVVLTHVVDGWPGALQLYQPAEGLAPTFAYPAWFGAIAGNGQYGVTLFFAVSAFTLTARLSSRTRDGLAAYSLRRIARVGPGYWLAGAAYALLCGLGPKLWAPGGLALQDFLTAAAFGSAWTGGPALAVVPGGWSVCCEVAFYAALPLVLRMVAGQPWRAVLLTLLALVAAQFRTRAAVTGNSGGFAFYINPLEQAPVFLMGVTASLMAMRLKLPRLPGAATCLTLLLVFAVPFSPIPRWYVAPHFLFGAVAAVATAFAAVQPPAMLNNGVMRHIGTVSYSIYLLHFGLLLPSLWLTEQITSSFHLPAIALHYAVTLGLSTALATVTYRVIEQPCIGWAARFGNKPPPACGRAHAAQS